MKPAPKLKNRIFRFSKLRTVDKAVTIEDTERPQEATQAALQEMLCTLRRPSRCDEE